jgi:hypothetical protein
MKIGGITVAPCEELLVLPRTDGEDIPIRAIAVSINDEFDKLAPEPIAPMIQVKGGKQADLQDKDYLAAVSRRSEQRFAFLLIKSLEPSNIEWEKVKLDDPKTWSKWEEELWEAGLSSVETGRIIASVMVANSLDDAKIEEARKSFLLGQGA